MRQSGSIDGPGLWNCASCNNPVTNLNAYPNEKDLAAWPRACATALRVAWRMRRQRDGAAKKIPRSRANGKR